VLVIEAKNIFGNTFASRPGAGGRKATGAAEELGEVSATGSISVSEWAAEWQSLLPLA
jgi:hypothetical protein